MSDESEYDRRERDRDDNTERWRGEIGANLRHVKENVRATAKMVGDLAAKIDQHERDVDKRFRELEAKVQQMATRLAIYTGIAAFLGSGIMSALVAILLRK
jgi:hypothetical protein